MKSKIRINHQNNNASKIINGCIQLKYIDSFTCMFLLINKIYFVLPAVLYFHGTHCCEDFTPIFLVEDNRCKPFIELIGKHDL